MGCTPHGETPLLRISQCQSGDWAHGYPHMAHRGDRAAGLAPEWRVLSLPHWPASVRVTTARVPMDGGRWATALECMGVTIIAASSSRAVSRPRPRVRNA